MIALKSFQILFWVATSKCGSIFVKPNLIRLHESFVLDLVNSNSIQCSFIKRGCSLVELENERKKTLTKLYLNLSRHNYFKPLCVRKWSHLVGFVVVSWVFMNDTIQIYQINWGHVLIRTLYNYLPDATLLIYVYLMKLGNRMLWKCQLWTVSMYNSFGAFKHEHCLNVAHRINSDNLG